MKKSLIALAALATVATAAQAQSSVTLYGIIDSGVISVDGPAAGRVTGVTTGALATSRWGVRGTEDLGGGLKANFNLEGGLLIDAGAQGNSSVLFDRQSWVGLESAAIGTVQIGRTTRLDFDAHVTGDAMGAAGFASAAQSMAYNQVAVANGPASSSVNRYTNSIKATSARLAGFAVSYQHAFGEAAGDNAASRGIAYALDYTQGKAKATYAYSRQNDASGNKATEVNVASASYDFGIAKAFIGNSQGETAGNSTKTKVTWLGATAPLTANVTLLAQYYDIKNQARSDAKDADGFAVGATYAFSKRTTGYALAARVNNDPAANVSILGSTGISAAPVAGKDQTGYAVGIRHTF